jgi:ArsR family transcriptional regulator, arsenate/arsenite/antimonite-responsive transcriptional repressor
VLPLRVRGVVSPPALTLTAAASRRQAALLKALADPTRLQMVGILRRARQPVCICDLTETFRLSQPTVSHHMRRLKQAGLVELTRRGVWSYYRLRARLDPRTVAILDAIS